jgi:hypothetical protein
VWDAQTGDKLLELKGHTGTVNDVAVTPDGARIVTGSADRTARIWDARTGAELRRLTGHTRPVNSVAVTPDGARIVTSSEDRTARVWDAQTGAELLRLNNAVWNAFLEVAVTPDGGRIVTGSRDATARLWDLAQLRPPPVQHEFSTPAASQAAVDHAKAVVPRCLSIEQRKAFLLRPTPPRWCIEMGKHPYDTKAWKAWNAWKTADAVDSTIAEVYGNFADAALHAGDFRIALEAAELGITFDREAIWIRINRAHALMFLGRIQDARGEYRARAHRGTMLPNHGLWEKAVVDDFSKLRKNGRKHELMTEIEEEFKPSLPVEAVQAGE